MMLIGLSAAYFKQWEYPYDLVAELSDDADWSIYNLLWTMGVAIFFAGWIL